MIRYLEGRLFKKEEDRIVVLANGVGYEILLPAIVRKTFIAKRAGEDGEIVKLYIYYHQTERQPKPLLIGFNFEPEKEFFEKEIARERREIDEDPEHEKSEIREIYGNRGFTEEEISILIRRITSDKEQWLRFMLREELGLGDEAFESPARIGFTMGISFLLGSIVPLIPFFFFESTTALMVATCASIVFLFALGAFKTRITKRSWIRSGGEMLLIGMGSALVGYLLGLFVSRIKR